MECLKIELTEQVEPPEQYLNTTAALEAHRPIEEVQELQVDNLLLIVLLTVLVEVVAEVLPLPPEVLQRLQEVHTEVLLLAVLLEVIAVDLLQEAAVAEQDLRLLVDLQVEEETSHYIYQKKYL